MTIPRELQNVLAEDRAVSLVEDGIYSALSDTSSKHHYDKRAGIYDLVVGTRLYNAAMWGCSPHDYVAFAREAILYQRESFWMRVAVLYSLPRRSMWRAGDKSSLLTSL